MQRQDPGPALPPGLAAGIAAALVAALAGCGGAARAPEAPPDRAEALQWSRWFEQLPALDRRLERLERDHAVAARRLEGDERVVEQLAYLAERDRVVRDALAEVAAEGNAADPEEPLLHVMNELSRRGLAIRDENTAALRALLDEHAWFTIPRFGEQADRDGWWLAQHADGAPDLQREVLARLESRVASGETAPEHYARLFDHVAATEGRPQRFGTAGRCTGAGRWEPHPIEEPGGLAARRRAYGLPPFEDEAARLARACP